MFKSWFNQKNKHTVVVPAKEFGALQGVALIQAFSTDDEPKVKNFPKEKYKVYWEIFVNPVPGGYSSLVRFYSFSDGLLSEHEIAKQNVQELRDATTALIFATMEQNKR